MKRFSHPGRTALALLLVLGLAGCQSGKPQETATPPQTAAPSPSLSETAPMAEEYISGTYTAQAQGYGGTVEVTMTFDETRITDVKIVGDKETAGVGGKAVEDMPTKLLDAQSAEVDGVTGATFTSTAILSAAKSCIAQAKGEEEASTAGAVKMAPGTYTGSGTGFRAYWTIDATVTVSETEILSIDIAEDSADTVGVFPTAAAALVPRIIENQSVAVDSITGATASSNGIKAAVTEALKAALAAGGSDESALAAFQKIPEKSTATETLHTKVLVVGLGGAGTMAALRAAETMYDADPTSVDVLAIDKAGRYGGTSSLTADFFAVNPEQFKAEHNNGEDYVDKAALRADWLEYTRGDAKEELVDLLLNHSGETLDWMVYEHGLHLAPPAGGLAEGDSMIVKFQYAPNDKGLTIRREANLAFYDGCMEDYTAMGGKYMLETNGYALIYDEASHTVKGVKARGDDGTEYEIYAEAVILATGGFAGNGEMEEKYLSDEYYPLKGAWSQCGMTQCTGEMIEAAIGIGAGTYNIGMCPIVHMAATPSFLTQFEYHVTDGIQTSTNKPMLWTEGDLPMYMGIAANSLAVARNGERFTSEMGVAMLDPWKAGPGFYSIYSSDQIQTIAESGMKFPCTGPASINFGAVGAIPNGTPLPNTFEVLDAAVEAGIAVKADSLEELAQALGMEPETLSATVETYNGYCESGVDEQFGKKAEYLERVGEGPYYAIVMRSYCYCTCGGLDVNENLQVLDADGQVITGLYATGNDSSGVLYSEQDAYVTYGGAAQGWAYTSGSMAGKYAAEQVRHS